MSYYSFLHKSVKWWRKIYFGILEVAYTIYKTLAIETGERPMNHLAFRQKLVTSLSEPIRRSVVPRRRSGTRVAENIERLRPVQHFLQKERKRRDCMVCSNREDGGTRHLTLFVLGPAQKNQHYVPLAAYHTHKHYRH